jgi:hypothetical protein
MIRWYMVLDAKAVKQRLLHHRPVAHHQKISRYRNRLNQDLLRIARGSFSTK